MMVWLSVAAVVLVAVLGWSLYRRLGKDRITQLSERRRDTSRLVSAGQFVDGNRHLAVALALTDSTFFYENSEMQASLDLEWVREIEYSDELATGAPADGGRVLRLRSHSQSFEFVLAQDVAARWEAMLPPRQEVTSVLRNEQSAAVVTAT
jgi:hypothetical protein